MTWLLGMLAAITLGSNTLQVAANNNNFHSNPNVSAVSHKVNSLGQLNSSDSMVSSNSLQTTKMSSLLSGSINNLGTNKYNVVDFTHFNSYYNYFLLNPTSTTKASDSNGAETQKHAAILSNDDDSNSWGTNGDRSVEYTTINSDYYKNSLSKVDDGNLKYDSKIVNESDSVFSLILNRTIYTTSTATENAKIAMTAFDAYSTDAPHGPRVVYQDGYKSGDTKQGVQFIRPAGVTSTHFQILDISAYNWKSFLALTTWGLYEITLDNHGSGSGRYDTAKTTYFASKVGIDKDVVAGDISSHTIDVNGNLSQIIFYRYVTADNAKNESSKYNVYLNLDVVRNSDGHTFVDNKNITSVLGVSSSNYNAIGLSSFDDMTQSATLNESINDKHAAIIGVYTNTVNKEISPIYATLSKDKDSLAISTDTTSVSSSSIGSTIGFMDNTGAYHAYVIQNNNGSNNNLAEYTYKFNGSTWTQTESDNINSKITTNENPNLFIDRYNITSMSGAKNAIQTSIYVTYDNKIDEFLTDSSSWASEITSSNKTINKLVFLNNINLKSTDASTNIDNIIIATGDLIAPTPNDNAAVYASYIVNYANEVQYLNSTFGIKVNASELNSNNVATTIDKIIYETNNLNEFSLVSDPSTSGADFGNMIDNYYQGVIAGTSGKSTLANSNLYKLINAYDSSTMFDSTFKDKLESRISNTLSEKNYLYKDLTSEIKSKLSIILSDDFFKTSKSANIKDAFGDTTTTAFSFDYDGTASSSSETFNNFLTDTVIHKLQYDITTNTTDPTAPNMQQILNNDIVGGNGLIENWLTHEVNGTNSAALGLELVNSSFVTYNSAMKTDINDFVTFTKQYKQEYIQIQNKASELFTNFDISILHGFNVYPKDYNAYAHAFTSGGVEQLIKIVTGKPTGWKGYTIDISKPSSYQNDYKELSTVLTKLNTLEKAFTPAVNKARTDALNLLKNYLEKDLNADLHGYSITKLLTSAGLDYTKFDYKDFVGQNNDNPTIYSKIIDEAQSLYQNSINILIIAVVVPIAVVLILVTIIVTTIIVKKMKYNKETKKFRYFG